MTSKDCRRCTYLSSSKSRLQLSAEEFDDRCALVQRHLCQASLSRLLPNTKVLCSDAVSSRSSIRGAVQRLWLVVSDWIAAQVPSSSAPMFPQMS